MNNQTIFVTHVELLAQHFIKIHGQTNQETARIIEYSMPTVINTFSTFPPPVINMLYVDCMVLVYYSNNYFRGKFISTDAEKTANVLLIDRGNTVTVELANVRQKEAFVNVFFFLSFPFVDTSFEPFTQSLWIFDQRTATSNWIYSQSMHHLSRKLDFQDPEWHFTCRGSIQHWRWGKFVCFAYFASPSTMLFKLGKQVGNVQSFCH